ncbi:MIP family channel protein [Nocardioides sp. CF8]|uniref:MIP/aquaporin family protein n=1 Tax=Nocardioides sp. CF8 TaxID=110319 RepID=UPI00032EF184|nr:MIP/aquaporin family protein [Nocardioides sp. CF8]EON22717.1 MIP family channel protein [Nocardioides sp. CF8]
MEHAQLGKRLVAEAIGTAMLVLFGTGSVIAALTVGGGTLDYAGLGFISLAFAIVVALMIYGFGPVSGAHINPAVTIALAITRRFPWREVGPYVAVQLVGAAVGSLLVVVVFGTGAADQGLGMTSIAEGVSTGQAVVAEALGTFLLMFTIMAVAVDSRAPLGWAGFLIGLAVLGAILLIGPQTGGSLNPARTFGPDLVSSIFGGNTQWADLIVYVVGPVAGATVAAFLYDYVAEPGKVAVAVDETYTPTNERLTKDGA